VTRAELVAAEREGIRPTAYSLDGGLPDETYVLTVEDGGGRVFRGTRPAGRRVTVRHRARGLRRALPQVDPRPDDTELTRAIVEALRPNLSVGALVRPALGSSYLDEHYLDEPANTPWTK
jgi:hypothetical protein